MTPNRYLIVYLACCLSAVACGGTVERGDTTDGGAAGEGQGGAGAAGTGASGGTPWGGSGGAPMGGSGGGPMGGSGGGPMGGSGGAPMGGSGGTPWGGSGGGPMGGSGGAPMGGHAGAPIGGSGGSAGAAWDSCSLTSQCVVRPESCCGSCGAATRDDALALNQDYVPDYLSNNCANVDCPACYQATDPTLLAKCISSTCAVVDLLLHPSTMCTSSNDCRIRTKDCCECGGGMGQESLLAINVASESAFANLVCDQGTACPDCMPDYPDEVVADCVDGRCVAVW